MKVIPKTEQYKRNEILATHAAVSRCSSLLLHHYINREDYDAASQQRSHHNDCPIAAA